MDKKDIGLGHKRTQFYSMFMGHVATQPALRRLRPEPTVPPSCFWFPLRQGLLPPVNPHHGRPCTASMPCACLDLAYKEHQMACPSWLPPLTTHAGGGRRCGATQGCPPSLAFALWPPSRAAACCNPHTCRKRGRGRMPYLP